MSVHKYMYFYIIAKLFKFVFYRLMHVRQYIILLLSMPDIHKEIMMSDLAKYQSKGGVFSKPFIWTAVGITQPINWWKGLSCFTKLSKVASRILQLPASSAACERSFSTYSNIHCAKRNCLTIERARKLVLILKNLKLEYIKNDTRTTTPQIDNKSVANVSSIATALQSESVLIQTVNIENDIDVLYESSGEVSFELGDSDLYIQKAPTNAVTLTILLYN